MKLAKLKVNPDNPQIFNDLSKLENSIKEFPKMMELRPLIIDIEKKAIKDLIKLYPGMIRNVKRKANEFTITIL